MWKKTLTTLLTALCFCISAFTTSWAQDIQNEVYIEPDLLDIDRIRAEEMLDDTIKLVRIYIFLAVLHDGVYNTYTTSGEEDIDNDGKIAREEPNDLPEYKTDTPPIAEKMSIMESDYTCFISGLPNFEELFPEDDDPLQQNSLISVYTSADSSNAARLTGVKTIPIVSEDGQSQGIERFIAFYNKKGGDDAEQKDIITSFGFIEVKMMTKEEDD